MKKNFEEQKQADLDMRRARNEAKSQEIKRSIVIFSILQYLNKQERHLQEEIERKQKKIFYEQKVEQNREKLAQMREEQRRKKVEIETKREEEVKLV